ncbi:hypothetical protein V5R04_02810 [Jonesiaceae bacterium BS-20]|uniref:Uncharacterized protein n=1 Tax=Jonesiaceae bacterium BS-20 TaxID=3120821 RepID=A0AAU7DY28_9MICO
MKRSWKFLKDAKATELLASAVLAFEALYFIIATLVVTGFGVVYAKGSADAHGLLGMVSLPLIAVGAFAIWSLALLHVLPPVAESSSARSDRSPTSASCQSTRRVSMTGFYLVVAAHLVYALLLIGQERLLLASAIMVLTGLLLVCSVTQVHLPNKRRKAILANQATG